MGILDGPREKSLLLIGASCRAAGQSASAAGFKHLSAIDFFADRDLAAIADVGRMAEFSDAVEIARRFPAGSWMYVGGMENHPDIVAEIATERPLWGNSAETLRRVRDPYLFAAECAAAEIPCPPLMPQLSAGDDPQKWLRKKVRSCGGLGIEIAADRESRDGWYFQRHLHGEPASAAFVSAGSEAVLLGTAGQLIPEFFHAPRPFQYAGSFTPFYLKEEQLTALAALGRRLTQAFGLVGLWGLDFLLCDDVLFPLEVNPRYCASFELLEARQQRSFVALHADACRGCLPNETEFDLTGDYRGKQIVYADRALEVTAAQSAWFDTQLISPSPEIADIPVEGTLLRPGDPLATVFAGCPTRNELFRTLSRRRRELLQRFAL